MPHQPRKRFGQHFLQDSGVIACLIALIDPRPGQQLVEIGPGQGVLTRELLRACGRLHAVELDRDLIEPLRHSCAPFGELTLHAADALRFDFRTLARDGRLRIVGNLPYNISTPLLFHLLEQSEAIQDMHFMLQKEVVERMAASPGGKDYGRLSVMLQARCQVIPLLAIGPAAFRPAPKVDSAFVRLVPFAEPRYAIGDPAAFATLVAAAFAHRRKTLRNNLKGLLSEEQIANCAVDPADRAEVLDLDAFVRLAHCLRP
jgi:16S rRNA (adenine1518-N6/adenine1519-N6)-dimethyltransferase